MIHVDSTITTYTATDLIAGASYDFRIAAYNKLYQVDTQFDDELNFSKLASFIVANVPSKVQSLSQSTKDYETGKVKLIWSQPSNNGSPITSYLVQRDVGSGVFFKVYEGVSPQFTDTGLEAGQNYNYRVRANNIVGYGDFSDVLTAIAGSIPRKITT